MKVRGRRECLDCGATWSYYETGSVTCPDCGGIESRGLDDERRLHTAAPVDLDLSTVRADADDRPTRELTAAAKETCRTYVRRDGFLRGGDLLALDDVAVAARELLHAADLVGRTRQPDDDEELYLLALLEGAEAGDRPAPDEVPTSLRAARGLAVADAVDDYLADLRDWLEEHPRPAARAPLERADQHAARLAALQGAVPPATAERLLAATRDVARYCRDGDDDALAAAAERLDRLEAFPHD